MVKRAGIWGHYHGKNLGDDILVATVTENLRRRLPDVELVGYSLDPHDTAQRHGIPAHSMQVGSRMPVQPNRGDGAEGTASTISARPAADVQPSGAKAVPSGRPAFRHRVREFLASSKLPVIHQANTVSSQALSLWRSRASLHDVDMLIVAGSGPLYDGWDGAWNHPFNLYSWSQIARTTGTKFVALSVGAGPFNEPLTRYFIRKTIESAHYVSCRDWYSASLVDTLGVEGKRPIFPDLAFGLHPSELDAARARSTPSSRPVVGISTMAHQDPRHMPRGSNDTFVPYVVKLADVAEWVLSENMIPSFLRSDRADDLVANDVLDLLERRGIDPSAVRVPETDTHQDLLTQIAECDVVLGGRFHCHVLPMLFGIPVLGLAYHVKSFDMMSYMGQADYILDINAADSATMIRGLEKLLLHRDSIRDTLLARSEVCREAVWHQYDALVDGTIGSLTGVHLPETERPVR